MGWWVIVLLCPLSPQHKPHYYSLGFRHLYSDDHSFPISTHNCFLSSFWVLGIVLNAEDAAVKSFGNLYSVGDINNKNLQMTITRLAGRDTCYAHT